MHEAGDGGAGLPGGRSAGHGASHFHVHLLRGERAEFFRGLTVIEDGRGGESWQVWDDAGEIGPPERRLAEGLTLAEALRVALELTARHLGEPVRPLLGAAPFHLLGYRPARRRGGWLGWIRRPVPPPGGFDVVGEDGLPRAAGGSSGG